MISHNLRHLRVFLAVAETGSPTVAAGISNVSQPAVTQAIAKLERRVGAALFDRTRTGFVLTERGEILRGRVRRAMDRLDGALAEVSPRLAVTASLAQLQALIAVVEAGNFSLAARGMGLAQPTVHRAVTQLESEAGRPLFQRTPQGVIATRVSRDLARAARLAISELGQANSELADFDGREVGRIVVGCLPLARSVILPEALVRFRRVRPKQRVSVAEAPYMELLRGLRAGEVDVIIGALRDPVPIDDVVQEQLFADDLAFIARPGHALMEEEIVPLDVLAQHGWVVPREGTPTREQFDELFATSGLPQPDSIIECGSILLMRELLALSDLVGCISAQQAGAEIDKGLIGRLNVPITFPRRAIGLTMRKSWLPTRAQDLLLKYIREAAPQAQGL
ncbi:Galactose-binding protein regulator (plasmid) [Paracoccaceae bacterium]|nr:Galactose-binding protein regulator [Paracoccaceae bacterium]